MLDSSHVKADDRPGIVIREAFLRSLRMIGERPGVLGIFFKNSFLLIAYLFALVLGAWFVIGKSALAVHSLKIEVFVVVVGILILSVVYWYLYATATGAIIVAAVAWWHGNKVRVKEARRVMGRRVRSVMVADVLNGVGVALLGLLLVGCAIFVLMTQHQSAVTNPAAPSDDSFWIGAATVAVISCVEAILAAYTALALRHVVFSTMSSREALLCAHQEIAKYRRIYGPAMIAVAVITFGFNESIDSHVVLKGMSSVKGALDYLRLLIDVVNMASVIFQTLPYIWIAESIDAIPLEDVEMVLSLPEFSHRSPSWWERMNEIVANVAIIAIVAILGVVVLIVVH